MVKLQWRNSNRLSFVIYLDSKIIQITLFALFYKITSFVPDGFFLWKKSKMGKISKIPSELINSALPEDL